MTPTSPNSVSYLTLLNALALKNRLDMPSSSAELMELVQQLIERHWELQPGTREEWVMLQIFVPQLKTFPNPTSLSS